MSQAVLEVRRARRTFGSLTAVDDVNLTVHPGEVVGLIGPNGSGKSTLINLIAGALPFERGELFLGGQCATKWSQQKRCHWGLARSRQIARPLGQMTVLENVTVGAIFGSPTFISSSAATKIAQRVLDELALEEFASALPTQLPIQKLKTLEIARALSTEPRVLLLDESMAGLGSGEAERIMDLILRKRAAGLGIVVIEHRIPELISISDKMVVLSAGSLLCSGAPEEVVEDPEVMRVYLGIGSTAQASAPGNSVRV